MMRKSLTVLSILLLSTASVYAQDAEGLVQTKGAESVSEAKSIVRQAYDLMASDPVQARSILESGAENPEFLGWDLLGNMRLRGIGGSVDEAGAFKAYEKADELGLPFVSINLGRMTRDGVGTQKDGDLALTYFTKAMSGKEDEKSTAVSELISGHLLSRFGSSSDAGRGIDLAQTSIAEGNLNAALAVLSIPSRLDDEVSGLSELRSPALMIAESAADAGEPLAARRILGYWHPLSRTSPDAMNNAADAVTRYEAILDPEQVIRHQALYLAVNMAGKGGVSKLTEITSGISGRDLSTVALDIFGANKNAYVAVLQGELSKRGLYDGPTSGTLTAKTIKAINAFCREAGIYDQCAEGPMRSSAAIALSGALGA